LQLLAEMDEVNLQKWKRAARDQADPILLLEIFMDEVRDPAIKAAYLKALGDHQQALANASREVTTRANVPPVEHLPIDDKKPAPPTQIPAGPSPTPANNWRSIGSVKDHLAKFGKSGYYVIDESWRCVHLKRFDSINKAMDSSLPGEYTASADRLHYEFGNYNLFATESDAAIFAVIDAYYDGITEDKRPPERRYDSRQKGIARKFIDKGYTSAQVQAVVSWQYSLTFWPNNDVIMSLQHVWDNLALWLSNMPAAAAATPPAAPALPKNPTKSS
jgi:hypothetical protein